MDGDDGEGGLIADSKRDSVGLRRRWEIGKETEFENGGEMTSRPSNALALSSFSSNLHVQHHRTSPFPTPFGNPIKKSVVAINIVHGCRLQQHPGPPPSKEVDDGENGGNSPLNSRLIPQYDGEDKEPDPYWGLFDDEQTKILKTKHTDLVLRFLRHIENQLRI
ncbi:hypothetical protein L2E82_07360 [Cichorium intybus]|uniref:Uncharacterized protein n=1 Tax=Cichorium intybus TaxID=13427 RepID=A0ACB9G3X5_CICIN|nr:hypothetical protein L2E82_07360 [Cichorium intybus]